MTEFVSKMLQQLNSKSYRACRSQSTAREDEHPILYPVDIFGFHHGSNWRQESHGGNLTPDYPMLLNLGMDGIRQQLVTRISQSSDPERIACGERMLAALDGAMEICRTHRETVKKEGSQTLYKALCRVPFGPAESLYEALVSMKALIYCLRVENVDHIGLGRFDQYLYPYYLRACRLGMSREEILELLEAFFIELNYDTDLYIGMLQGDNGQSMVLGGFDGDGNSQYNELSQLCMEASLELSLIEPKINLRVGKNTPPELYEFGTLLTKQGLGFPQYSNDDVVVPGLISLGYSREDALDYVVAACWEFIIPGKGADIPNIRSLNFPLVVNYAVRDHLAEAKDFETFLTHVDAAIVKECKRLIDARKDTIFAEQPLLSVFVAGCVESLRDLWHGGAVYSNFGCHGPGISNAADALMAIKKLVFDEKRISPQELISALDADFEGYTELRNLLRECPKMGNNDDAVDSLASYLMTKFSDFMNGQDNGHGGIWRAGTGSAQGYVRSARICGATADGRKAAEPYGSSFSPALDVKTTGLLSVIQSFTKHDLSTIINGGPLTLEIHDSLLRNAEGISKTAQLVKIFIDMGGHQIQLNAINREILLDAQKHPEKYPNLIVRVWGWSGYFNELEVDYQNHIIRRTEYLR